MFEITQQAGGRLWLNPASVVAAAATDPDTVLVEMANGKLYYAKGRATDILNAISAAVFQANGVR